MRVAHWFYLEQRVFLDKALRLDRRRQKLRVPNQIYRVWCAAAWLS